MAGSEQFPGRSGTVGARGSNQGKVLDRSGGTVDPLTGGVIDDVPSIMDVERTIVRLEREIDDLTDDFANWSAFASDAQCKWENHRDRVYLAINREVSGEKGDGLGWRNEGLSQARAKGETCVETGEAGEALFAMWRTYESALSTASKGVSTRATRLSVQQSLLKHLRQISGLEDR